MSKNKTNTVISKVKYKPTEKQDKLNNKIKIKIKNGKGN